MIKSAILGLVSAMCLGGVLMCAAEQANAQDILTITKDTVIVKGGFDGKMAGKFIMDISKSQGEVVEVFIDSPGGSIDSLLEMMDFMDTQRALGKKFRCMSNFAASAASALFNYCDERLIMNNTTLMFHNASFGLRGGASPHVATMYAYINKSIDVLEVRNAKRMRMSLSAYRAAVRDDLWLYGKEGITRNAADKITNITCDPSLFSVVIKQKVDLGMFTLDVEWSGCPLITYPMTISGMSQLPQTVDKKTQQKLNYT